MALRDQPYLPLYIQDFLTDEKLIECSAASTGVYIRLLCIMHKSDEYGTILLRQKDKQNSQQVENFAYKLSKQMPYPEEEIHKALHELIDEGVLSINGDKLLQKRMLEDNNLSLIRADAGRIGGFATAKKMANQAANTEYEYETENENKNVNVNKRRKTIKKPTIEQVKEYCKETNSPIDPEYFWHFYESTGWIKANNQPVLNWKSTIKTWEKRNIKDKAEKRYTKTQLANIESMKELEKEMVAKGEW